MADLPEIMWPLVDYLESLLAPYPTVRTTVLTLLSHSYTLLSSLISLVSSIFTSGSPKLDAETILPPLITLLTAYLALISFYRTTGWLVRTAFAFVKWSFILTSLGALAGYFIANANVDGQGAAGLARLGLGFLPAFGGFMQEMVTGQSHRPAKKQQRKQKPSRPKVHESWDRHREWQYSENQPQQGADVQKVIGDILGNVRENAPLWWETVKVAAENVVKGFSQDEESPTKAENTRSR